MRKIATVGAVKVYRDSEWDEYQCKAPDGSTYHTDCKADALATAEAMDLKADRAKAFEIADDPRATPVPLRNTRQAECVK